MKFWVTEKVGGKHTPVITKMRKKDILDQIFSDKYQLVINGNKMGYWYDPYENRKYLFHSMLFKNGYIFDSEFRNWRHIEAKNNGINNWKRFIYKETKNLS